MQIFRARKQIRAMRWDGRSLDEILTLFVGRVFEVVWADMVEGRSISFAVDDFTAVLKPGMWIVDDPEEDLTAMTHDVFVHRYEPLGGAVMD